MSTPQTTIYICSGVRLNSRYEHTIYFKNKADQLAYFSGKVVKTLPAYSFIRRSWTLKVESPYHEALRWNYLYFLYPNDSRYYYYFVNKVEYVNDATVELTLELDLMQTYLKDYECGECLVEREHVSNDSIGAHTVSEGLETGAYVDGTTNWLGEWGYYSNKYSILILATCNPMTTTGAVNAVSAGAIYGNVYSGLGLYAVEASNYEYLNDKLESNTYVMQGIVAMWMYPTELIELEGDQEVGDGLWCHNVAGVKGVFKRVPRPSKLGSYTPKNNKLLTYPYNFLYLSNNNGGQAHLRYEFFEEHDVDKETGNWLDVEGVGFTLMGALSPSASVRAVPYRYGRFNNNGSNNANDNDYGLTLPPFPTCAWDSDTYKIWLAQNQNNQTSAMNSAAISMTSGGLSALAGIVGVVAGIATGGVGAAVGGAIGAIGGGLSIASGVNQAQATVGREETASKLPDQAQGTYSSSLAIANGKLDFIAVQKHITAERAKIIDDYFTMYGYKVNRMGLPYPKRRKRFTYVKTQGCHVFGEIPNEDIIKIESIYDRGVTFWVNGDDIGNYSASNEPL